MAAVRKEYTPWIINQKTGSKSTKIDGVNIAELAKFLNLTIKEILDTAQELDIPVKSHTSVISNSSKDKIMKKLAEKNIDFLYKLANDKDFTKKSGKPT